MAVEANGRWSLVKVNTEEHPDLAAAFDITSIPAVKLFVKGEVVKEFVGALPEREIRRFLEQAMPSPNGDRLAEAQRYLAEGGHAKAAGLLEPIVKAEPQNLQARLLLAQALLNSAPERIGELIAPVGPESEWADKAEALKVLGRLAELADGPEALPQADVKQRYLAGAAAVRAGDFGAAVPMLIEVLERNRAFDNEGAKMACRAIFQLLGMRHPLVERYFRAFSSSLHC